MWNMLPGYRSGTPWNAPLLLGNTFHVLSYQLYHHHVHCHVRPPPSRRIHYTVSLTPCMLGLTLARNSKVKERHSPVACHHMHGLDDRHVPAGWPCLWCNAKPCNCSQSCWWLLSCMALWQSKTDTSDQRDSHHHGPSPSIVSKPHSVLQ